MCTLTEKPGAESSVTKKFMDSCSVSEMPVAEAESSVAVKPRMALYSGDKMTADTAQSDGGSSSDPQAGSYYAAHSGSGYDDPKAGVRTAYEGSKDYEAPAGSADYEAPAGTADYETPAGSADYEIPALDSDYNIGDLVEDTKISADRGSSKIS